MAQVIWLSVHEYNLMLGCHGPSLLGILIRNSSGPVDRRLCIVFRY